jgi:hypothetical protein
MIEGIFGAIFALLGWSAEPELTHQDWTKNPCPPIGHFEGKYWLPSHQFPPDYTPFGMWQVDEWRKVDDTICRVWVKR